MSKGQREINPAILRSLEAQARSLGRTLDDSIAEREDMIRLLEEILLKMKVGQMTDWPDGIDANN